ncbi:MAG: hypothetical protein IPH60_16510 [Flavobacteriales bacterium]|nr:hypothetical protein [Flavobacteriales bacterium]
MWRSFRGTRRQLIVYAANIQQVAAVLSGNAAAMIKPAIHHSIPVLFPKWNLDRMITVEAGNYTTMNVTCIRAGVKDLPSGDLVAKARFVAQCLTGNPYFPAPVPSLATCTQQPSHFSSPVAAQDRARSWWRSVGSGTPNWNASWCNFPNTSWRRPKAMWKTSDQRLRTAQAPLRINHAHRT